MAQTLPEGAFVLPADIERIAAAQADLEKTKNAHGSLMVRVNLHVHYEYPKQVMVGDKPVTVNSAAEELALATKEDVADDPKAPESGTKTKTKKAWVS